MRILHRVLVYAASSPKCDAEYLTTARSLGQVLASAGVEVIYGGGGVGLMGELANGALHAGGRVTGVLPRFMDEVEWGHKNLSELVLVESMHERKRLMLERSDAIIALPGGCGTLEELFEAITWKRLGLATHPIVMLNTRGFYNGVVDVLNRCIEERFMGNIIGRSGPVLTPYRRSCPRCSPRRSGPRMPAIRQPCVKIVSEELRIFSTGPSDVREGEINHHSPPVLASRENI